MQNYPMTSRQGSRGRPIDKAPAANPAGQPTAEPAVAADPVDSSFKYKDYNLVFVSFDALQAAAGAGEARAYFSPSGELGPEQLVDWLRWSWQKTEVTRLRFLRAADAHEQMTLRLEGDQVE